jgi:phosphoenolpyruvate carboxykinase (GTP)
VETPIGLLPAAGAIPIDGIDVTPADMDELLRVDTDEWRDELPSIEEHYAIFGDRLPAALGDELEALRKRLG